MNAILDIAITIISLFGPLFGRRLFNDELPRANLDHDDLGYGNLIKLGDTRARLAHDRYSTLTLAFLLINASSFAFFFTLRAVISSGISILTIPLCCCIASIHF